MEKIMNSSIYWTLGGVVGISILVFCLKNMKTKNKNIASSVALFTPILERIGEKLTDELTKEIKEFKDPLIKKINELLAMNPDGLTASRISSLIREEYKNGNLKVPSDAVVKAMLVYMLEVEKSLSLENGIYKIAIK